MSEPTIDANTLVSHTDESGRTLSGVGVSAERLAETMERHAPEETTSESPAPAAGPAAPAEAPAAPVSRGRQRFSDLTRERDEAKAAAEAAKAEREQFARERDELRQRLEQASRTTAPPAEPPAPVERKPTRPMPTDDEIGTKYQTVGEFALDIARWEREQQAAESAESAEQYIRSLLAQERAREQLNTARDAARERARKAYPDFDTLLKGPVGNIPLGPTEPEANRRVAFIMQHPQSEHIQYAILKDAALAERLRASDPVTFGMTIAALVPAAKPAAPAWTPPPPPHPTVGASSPTTAVPSSELAKKGFDFDASGYREKRAAERGVKTRRW